MKVARSYHIYVQKKNIFINLSVLQRIQTANYDLQTELEDFVALQAARERAEKE